jgi:hypothetical protein
MYDETLIEVAAEADHQLRANLTQQAPGLATAVDGWLEELFGSASLAEVFTRPDAYPTILMPWWLDGSIGDHERRLHRALSYSTMNGYLYIRLVDNLMDGDGPADVGLLPALGFFHLEFLEPYRQLFGPGHRFWSDVRRIWLQTAEATLLDSTLEDIDRTAFESISARKTGAAKIPIAAVCHYRQRLHVQPRWSEFVDGFSRWHQMHNDVFSWRKDVEHDATTYFLSEARRQRRDGTVESWFIDGGFHWAIDRLDEYMFELKRIANTLEPSEPLVYLSERERMLATQVEEVEVGLAAAAGVRAALRD